MLPILEDFLHEYLIPSKPVLLGVSGGPDSLALLYLMLELGRRFPLQLGIAHIDHGWRQGSADEAAQLAQLAASLGLPFHLKTLNPQGVKGNLEEHCREERLSFFAGLCQSHHYQAVALAHHGDDQAETVLKRIFEGASIPYLVGMKPVSTWNGLCVWRPLLQVKKEALLRYAERCPFKPFDDQTNRDPQFLRGRMRTSLIPRLSREFGKEVTAPLRHLSSEALEWREYLQGQVQPVLDGVVKGKMGLLLDLGRLPIPGVELKYIIGCFCKMGGFGLSRCQLQEAARMVGEHAANKRLQANGGTLQVDRGVLFVPTKAWDVGSWEISCKNVVYGGEEPIVGWRNIWNGHAATYLPPADYTVQPASVQRPYPRTSPLGKFWADAKVPAFLRPMVPVAFKGDAIAFEFLTGQTFYKPNVGQEVVHISLQI